jgi:hypothetical protein
MVKKESTNPATTVATEKKARRNIRAEIDAIPAGPLKAKIEDRYAAFLDDKQAVKDSKKKLFAGLDFVL